MFGLRSRCRSVVGRLIRAVSRRVNSAASIGPNDHGARPYKQFGNGSIISWPTGNMYGERWISIGENTMIASHVTLSAGMVPDQQMMTDPVVIIGDRCLIGRGSSIVGHYRIDIGDDVYTGMNVYITDQNHGYEDLEMPIGIQNPHDDPVVIGSGSWIGSGAVVLPGAQIGKTLRCRSEFSGSGTFPTQRSHSGGTSKSCSDPRWRELGATGNLTY